MPFTGHSTLEDKTIALFQNVQQPVTQCHISEGNIPEQHYCKSLKIHKLSMNLTCS
jgi:hypothetical protein